MLSEKQRLRLRAEAEVAGVDPAALVATAERLDKESGGSDSGGKKGQADRLLIGHLHWVTVNELRGKLGLPPVPGGDEFCTAFAIQRGMVAPPGGAGAGDGESDDEA